VIGFLLKVIGLVLKNFQKRT